MNKTHSSGFFQRVLSLTFSGWGARIGAIWIGILTLMAVFSPFIANTVPLLASQNGEITIPFLRYFTIEDTLFLSAFIFLFAIIKTPLKKFLSKPVLTFFLLMFITSILANLFIKPPALIIYDDFRLQQKYEWSINAPIPFSARDYMRDVNEMPLTPPLASSQFLHYMGTEENGADVFSRMIHASRIALSIGFIATGIALIIGVILGSIMGYFSGIVDMLGMRLVEIFESVPTLFLLLTFVAFFGRNIYLIMVIIGLTSWSGYARYARAEFLKLRKQDYVQAAIASGLPLNSILFRHMLPNGVAPLLVSISFGVASAILAEATLSFLGLGPVDAPSWGQMLNQSIRASTFNWWMAVFPGGAIFMTVFAYNLIGEALRDALDPKASKKEPSEETVES
jgi:peptide/nickel transport system permease protein